MTTKELLQQALDALLPHSSSHGNSWRAVEDAAIDALKQAIAQEQEIARNCITCKYSHEPANSAVCTDCKHAYTSADHWEPKP